MTEEAKERMEVVAAMPHVQRWLKRFRSVAQDMPPEVWVYVAAGTPTVMANGENNRPIESGRRIDAMDRDATITLVRGGHWDGGDW